MADTEGKKKTVGINFEVSTLDAWARFNKKIAELKKTFPDFQLKTAREYLKTGEKDSSYPDALYEFIKTMQEERATAIAVEMRHGLAKAYVQTGLKFDKDTIKIPEKYMTGKSLTPFFDNDLYELNSSFRVYECFQWYEPAEIETLRRNRTSNRKPEPSKEYYEEGITEYVEANDDLDIGG